MAYFERACLFGVAAFTMLSTVAAAMCCMTEVAWPKDDQGPDGACSGDKAVVCEEGVKPLKSDPAARKPGLVRQAYCYEWNLPASAYFVRTLCTSPPANSKLVGRLPNGSCCFVVSIGPVEPNPVGRTFWFTPCDSNECTPT